MAIAFRMVAAFAALTGVMLAQTTGKVSVAGKSPIETAIDEAGRALQYYQGILVSLNDLSEMDTTARGDSQVVLSGRNAVMWLRSKEQMEGAVDPFEFEGLLHSINICAANAALSSSVLVAAASTRNRRKLQAAKDLLSTSEELRDAVHHLEHALKPYLQLEKPPRMV